jgi:hypothetical protein
MTLAPALIFLAFTVVSFLMLRYVLANFAREERAIYAVPLLIAIGAISGVLFAELQLGQYYIWFLMIFALIIIRWHAESRPENKKVKAVVEKVEAEAGAAKTKTAAKQDVAQTYAMTRRILSFALVSYLAAFSATFYYLFTSGR